MFPVQLSELSFSTNIYFCHFFFLKTTQTKHHACDQTKQILVFFKTETNFQNEQIHLLLNIFLIILETVFTSSNYSENLIEKFGDPCAQINLRQSSRVIHVTFECRKTSFLHCFPIDFLCKHELDKCI